MRRLMQLVLGLVAVFLFTRATCGPRRAGGVKPVLRHIIADRVPFHNVGITFDGQYYYTINGGNEEYSVVNQYDRAGTFVRSYDFGIDGRAIGCDPSEGRIYAKAFGEDLLLLNFDTEEADIEHELLFAQEQTSVGFSPDGRFIYELDDGELIVYDAVEGDELDSYELEHYSEVEEGGYAYSIAASDRFIFAWKNEKEINVYDLTGRYITSFDLPNPGFGFSLSYCNGLLWVASDADGGTDGAVGRWYGYKLEGLE